MRDYQNYCLNPNYGLNNNISIIATAARNLDEGFAADNPDLDYLRLIHEKQKELIEESNLIGIPIRLLINNEYNNK